MNEAESSNAAAAHDSHALVTSSTRRISGHFGFVALLLILFLTFLDNTIISAVLSNVQSELHSGISQLQWVVGGYALAFASLMLMCGSLGDNYGRKKIILVGVAIFCAGSVVCALAGSSTMLVIGRVIMGVGAAASEPGTLSMIRCPRSMRLSLVGNAFHWPVVRKCSYCGLSVYLLDSALRNCCSMSSGASSFEKMMW